MSGARGAGLPEPVVRQSGFHHFHDESLQSGNARVGLRRWALACEPGIGWWQQQMACAGVTASFGLSQSKKEVCSWFKNSKALVTIYQLGKSTAGLVEL